jgi:hypothetical protein
MLLARWTACAVATGLLALPGCRSLDPAAAYRQAARQLEFTLDQVEPSLQVAFPLEQSKLGLRLTLGAKNPTTVRFKARSLEGGITLDSDGASHAVGQMSLAQGLDLPPSATTPVVVDLLFAYKDLRGSWSSLRSVGSGNRPGTWRLDGHMGLEVLGIPMAVPLKVQKHVSGR